MNTDAFFALMSHLSLPIRSIVLHATLITYHFCVIYGDEVVSALHCPPPLSPSVNVEDLIGKVSCSLDMQWLTFPFLDLTRALRTVNHADILFQFVCSLIVFVLS
jgi:hypothetical protein